MNKNNVSRNKYREIVLSPKRFKKLGTSVPKSRKVKKSSTSPSRGTKISEIKSLPSEIYNEALTNLSSIKDNLLYNTKKSHNFSLLSNFFTNNNEFLNSQLEHEMDSTNINDSFGSPKTKRSFNSNLSITKLKGEDCEWNEISTGNILINNEANSKINQSENSIKNDVTPGDSRLRYVLNLLDLNQLFHLFNSSNLTFNDILILSKEDLVEMNVQMAARNRILKFSEAYKSQGKHYILEEIKEFFMRNKNFCFQNLNFESYVNDVDEASAGMDFRKNHNNRPREICINKAQIVKQTAAIFKGNEDKANIYETLSTANFNHENQPSSNSPVKPTSNLLRINQNNSMIDFYHSNIANDPSVINPNLSFYDDSTTLADYISCNYSNNFANKSKNLGKNLKLNNANKQDRNKSIVINNEKLNDKNDENMFFNKGFREDRSDSEEKAIQTKKIEMDDHKRFGQNQFNSSDNFLSNIRHQNDEFFYKIQNENNLTRDDKNKNNIIEEECVLEQISDDESNKRKICSSISEKNFDHKKIKNIYKNFQSISDDIGKYMKSFKDHKEKSENRSNRLKCIINKSIRCIKNSKSKEKNYRDCNIIIYKNLGGDQNNNNNNNFKEKIKENFQVDITGEDMEIEEERNLGNEMHKILNYTQSEKEFELDANSSKRLNRNKKMLDLKRNDEDNKQKTIVKNGPNPSSKELELLYSILEKKKLLQSNLNQCHSDILGNKKILKILEDENEINGESEEINPNKEIKLKNFTKTNSFRRPRSIKELDDVDYHDFEKSEEIANKIVNCTPNAIIKENNEINRVKDVPKKRKSMNNNNK